MKVLNSYLYKKTGKGETDNLNNKKEIKNEIIRLALPIAFQQFMLALVGASDAVMLGRLQQDAMSAVSLATQVAFVLNLFLAAVVIGENLYVAQYYGKKDYSMISETFRLALILTGIITIVFTVCALAFPGKIMYLFTNDPELIRMGSDYLRIAGISYLFLGVSQISMTLMKNCGAVGMSTFLSMVAVILNIILNAIFIFGLCGSPRMGIQGAALATVIATVIQAVWSFGYVMIRRKQVQFFRVRVSRELWKGFREKTAPVLFNELAWGGGFTMYSVILGHMGSDAVAANGIANISKNLIICFCMGLGSAGSIVVGNLLGANRLEEAKEAGKMATIFSIVSGIISGVLLIAFSPLIVRATGLTPQAQGYLQKMLLICSYYLAGKSVNCMTIGGIFTAGGDTKFGMICDTVTLWCVTVPLGVLCAFVFKLPVMVVYFVLNLDEIIKLPAVFIHYRQYKWVKNITME